MTKSEDFELKIKNFCVISEEKKVNALVFNTSSIQCDVIIDIPLDPKKWEEEYLRILGT